MPKVRVQARGRNRGIHRKSPEVNHCRSIVWLFALAGLLPGCSSPPSPPVAAPRTTSAPQHLGVQACASCHQKEAIAWQGSHHAAAMQRPTAKTVLGNFDNQSFRHGGVTSKFWRKGDQYWVTTDGPDGKVGDFRVQYTFGVYPLQQYLLALDRGRLQALNVVWDSRPQAQGGQRWFHLYPKETVDHRDILHWTGLYQNWNYMCSDCHSTGVNKGFDPDTKVFQTTSVETNVACEACHGPGSAHQQWAQAAPDQKGRWPNKGLTRSLGEKAQWSVQAGEKAPVSTGGSGSQEFLDTCARCHSRRSSLTQQPDGATYLDDYHPTFLEAPNYEADGQVLEEDYEYGAFLQSKMHAKGVTCRDCHDSHSLQLKAEGNSLCLNCHQAQFGASTHTHHAAASPGSSCIACHMPTHTYMGVHQRHDHSFRIPRPDQTVELGVPNACNQCHKDRSAAWAASAIQSWFGPRRKGFQTYAPALAAARSGSPRAEALLSQVASAPAVPPLARATALGELRNYLTQQSLPVVEQGLADSDPLVRLQALLALEPLPLEERWKRGESQLKDPQRAVRLQAARILGAAPEAELGAERNRALQEPLRELEASAKAMADRPETHLQMGVFYVQRGQAAAAEREYQAALELEPRLPAAYVNLADLYRSLDRDAEAERLLKQGLALIPGDAGLHESLGLTLVRRKQMAAALPHLRQAAQLAPQNGQYGYVLVVALDSVGQRLQALGAARKVLQVHPEHGETMFQAMRLAALLGKTAEAQDYGVRLQELAKIDPRVAAMLRQGR